MEVLASGCARAARCASPRRPGRLRLSSAKSANMREQLDLAARARRRPCAAARRARRGSAPACARRRRDRCRSRAAPRSGRRARGRRVLAPSVRGAGRSRSTGLRARRRPRPRRRRSARDGSSGAPVSTWLPADTCSSRTVAGERRVEPRLHLHRFEDEDGRAGGDLAADRDRRGHDQRRRGRAQHATLVAADPVRDAVDLDEVHRAVGRGEHAGTGGPTIVSRMRCVPSRSTSASTTVRACRRR